MKKLFFVILALISLSSFAQDSNTESSSTVTESSDDKIKLGASFFKYKDFSVGNKVIANDEVEGTILEIRQTKEGFIAKLDLLDKSQQNSDYFWLSDLSPFKLKWETLTIGKHMRYRDQLEVSIRAIYRSGKVSVIIEDTKFSDEVLKSLGYQLIDGKKVFVCDVSELGFMF